tara:strand:+ start:398 stop:631 length:234 start_codon:yes stop_codon:yes gene_type:complete
MSKISEVHLKELQEQEQDKAKILNELGALQIKSHSLNHLYSEIMEKQEKTKKELEQTYGKVNINLQDGSFELIEEDK